MPAFIKGNTRRICPTCSKNNRFARDVPDESLPIRYRCPTPGCGFSVGHDVDDKDHAPVFPKVDPRIQVDGDWIIELNVQDRVPDSGVVAQIPFRDRANGIADALGTAMILTKSLKKDIDKLEQAMLNDLSTHWGYYDHFIHWWNPKAVRAFVERPFLCLPVPSADPIVKHHLRLVIAPAFYSVYLGTFLWKDAGYWAQLVTPYSRYLYRLQAWEETMLDLPALPKLVVKGDKVLGEDLLQVWRDIPGIKLDDGHTGTDPSVRIENSMEARVWLARLGVCPWQRDYLDTDQDLWGEPASFFKAERSGEEATDDKRSQAAWMRWRRCGRMGIYYESLERAWILARNMASFVRYGKLVLSPNPKAQDEYGGWELLEQPDRDQSMVNGMFAWVTVTENSHLRELVKDTDGCIIVDYSNPSAFPPELLEELYQWNKLLLVILPDDLVLDTLDSNWEAARLYGLLAGMHTAREMTAHKTIQYSLLNEKMQEGFVASLLQSWARGHK